MELFRTTSAYRAVERDVGQGTVSHAYLLVCPDPRNLRGFLKQLAALLLMPCVPPAQRERAARLIAEEKYVDCRVFPAEGEKCGVEQVRALLDDSIVKPVEASRKLFVLDNVQDMLAPAQNKLLKVLEEPPANVCFVLGSTNEYAVLSTVRSRVKKLELLSFSEQDVEAYLRESEPACKNAREIAALSSGVLGRAQELAQAFGGESGAAYLLRLTPAGVPAMAREIVGREDASRLLASLRLALRDMLALKLGGAALLGADSAELERAAKKFSKRALVGALEQIGETERALRGNANPAAAVEALLCGILEGS